MRIQWSALCAAVVVSVSMLSAKAGVVEFKNNQLVVDGQTQPQLFGAELQYFRLRGGDGRNVPREKVLALWNKALDHLVEMKANAISFYIPWDFHEYAPGKFDFDGTVDEDGDGKPDYPSRDLKTFLQLVEAHGIHHILVRPGPYINAEWGFLGFGAVPLWFHQKYPNSHMRNSRGQRMALFGYNDPDFLRESQIWLETVYKQVLAPYIGPGRPIDFLQLDNETNFQWQSIYNLDYSPRAVADYRAFLQARYHTIAALNAAHHRAWHGFGDVKPPTAPELNLGEDQDWYRFQDESIHVYLQKIRRIWENLGVREPTVLFTLAESYNSAEHGLLPNYQFRNDPGKTGMMTVNLYPKTYDTSDHVLMNQPFKADHDVKAATSANAYYHGSKQEWAMGPEIQGGWWRGTDVTLESRQQTYLSTIGHGLKAVFIYYFNEGNNWQYDWVKNQLQPFYDTLRADRRYKDTPVDQLPNEFWNELNETFANKVLAGFDARWMIANGGTQTKDLYFDAALGADAEPRAPFDLLKTIGQKLVGPYGRFLASSTEMTDPVCFVKDPASNMASPVAGLDSLKVNSDWAAGLVAYLLQAGINPRILHWGLTPPAEYDACRLLVYQDNGFVTPDLAKFVAAKFAAGTSVVAFLDDGLLRQVIDGGSTNAACSRLPDQPIALNGVRCQVGNARFYQVRQPIYSEFSTDSYATLNDVPERRSFIDGVLNDLALTPLLRIKDGGDRAVAFGRTSPDGRRIWVTVKSGHTSPINLRVLWSGAKADQTYAVSRLLEGTLFLYRGADLATQGFRAGLSPNGSDVFFIEPLATPPPPPHPSLRLKSGAPSSPQSY